MSYSVQDVLSRLDRVKPQGSNKWTALCPAHDDHNPSLSIGIGDDDRILLKCHAGCTTQAVCDSIGIEIRDLFATEPGTQHKADRKIIAQFDYVSKDGELLYQVVRYPNKPNGSKDMSARRPDGNGGWVYKLNGIITVPYKLPELLQADVSEWVFVCEGEKDTDRLVKEGLIATTNPFGAGKWKDHHSEYLRGRKVVVLPDNDEAGKTHADVASRSLDGIAAEIKIIELPGLSEKGDVSDWMDKDGSKDELLRLADAAKIENVVIDDEWELPMPLGHFNLPVFPIEAFPRQLYVFSVFSEAVAESVQVPVDMPAMLVLSIAGTSLAKRVIVNVRGGYHEPVNLFTVVALPPGNRKSAVFRIVNEPLIEFERQEAERLKPLVDEYRNEKAILEKSLRYAQDQAAKAKDDKTLQTWREKTVEFVEKLQELKVVKTPQYIADDATPESVALLLYDNGGRIGLLSPEGDVFDLMAGRYNSGTPNLGVYLKGHAGDDIRVNRANRDFEPKFVHEPALSIGVAIQPEVLRGLTLKKGFRGRGLLGRFLYSLPVSTLGYRKINPEPIEPGIIDAYKKQISNALHLEPNLDAEGKPCPHIITVSKGALVELDKFAIDIEQRLGPKGDLHYMGDWAGKLVGAACRIAGIFHGMIHASSPATEQIDVETMLGAIAIAEYLIPHAKAAFFEMGADPAIDTARKILDWIATEHASEFTKSQAFNSIRGSVQKANEMDEPLQILVSHGYIRDASEKQEGPGRKRSPKYKINPRWLPLNTLNTLNSSADTNSTYSTYSTEEI